MPPKKVWFAAIIAVLLTTCASAQDKILKFSGYDWIVRPSGGGGPGPNHWDENNAWVDPDGRLHLRLAPRDGQWFCPEVYTKDRLGFGRYQFTLVGRVDKFDPNIVFGFFNYPTPDAGRDGQDEIDIEFSKWGYPEAKIGNYTVWPTRRGVHNASYAFPIDLGDDDASTHCFIWGPEGIDFKSFHGPSADPHQQFASWSFQPKTPADHIAQKSMPLHINLWCVGGHPPKDARPVELVVRSFQFTPR